MKTLKNILLSIYFQVGVNIIGLPEFHQIKFLPQNSIGKSKFHK
jgi:hypothetical protein